MGAPDIVGRMPQYGVEHAVALVVIAAAAVACTAIARRARRSLVDRVLGVCGWALLALSLLWTAWDLWPANFTIAQSLPVHLSDVCRYLTAIALVARAGWALAILHFWALTLTLQSVLTPDLVYLQAPALEYVAYWLLHGVPVVAAITLAWGLGCRPTWRGYAVAVAATVLWAGVAFCVNVVTGANYGYMNGAPAGRSLLDLLGPWPVYILWEAVFVAAVWALMTWAWEVVSRRDGATERGRWGLVRRAPDRSLELATS